MNQQDIQELVSNMTNEQLLTAFKDAEIDLGRAAKRAPNSDWHQACFAGFMTFANEISKRGLKLSTAH